MLYNGGIGNATQFDVNLAAYDSGYMGAGLVFMSAFGLSSIITQVSRQLKKKCNIRVNWNTFTIYPKTLEVYTSKMAESEYTHLLVYRKDEIYDREGKENIRFYAFIQLEKDEADWDSLFEMANVGQYPQKLIDVMYDKLYKMSPAPILKDWIPYILQCFINSGEIQLLKTIRSEYEKPFKCIMFDVAIEDIIFRISRGLRQHVITIDDADTVSPFMEEVQGIDAYLNEFSEVLTKKIQSSFVPRFIPGQDKYSLDLRAMIDYIKYSDKINLYTAQKDVAQAISNALDHNKVAWLIATMGSGKTAMAITSVNTHHRELARHASRDYMNNIVMCPGHLVNMWKREIERRSPRSEAIVVKDFEHLLTLMPKIKGRHRYQHLWLIISQETAKFGYTLRPVAVWNKSKKVPGENRHGVYCCPHCGQPLYYEYYAGSGRRKEKRYHYLDETDFRDMSIKNNNITCTNLVRTWNKQKSEYEYVPCNTYLWGPSTHENVYDGIHEDRWLKMGKNGWIQKQHAQTVHDRLAVKSETETLTNDEIKLLSALNDLIENGMPPQVTPRKYPISKYIKKYLKGYINYFIGDEQQNFKGKDSLQGQSYGDFIQVAKYSLGLTGTLLNGYSSGIFYLLFRSFSKKMLHEGYEFNDVNEFIKDYGVTKQSMWYEVGRNGTLGDMSGKKQEKELPGISPIVFTKFLLEHAVFVDLEDISDALPSYEEIPVPVDMPADLSAAYTELEQAISNSLAQEHSSRWLSQSIQLMSVYPDQPYGQPPIYNPENNDIIVVPRELSEEYREKESVFLDIVQRKIDNGEHVLVYYAWTNKTNVAERLSNLLRVHDISAAVLTTSISPAEREEWIQRQVANGVQVLLCNPKLVETGLTLLDFTTIIFYQLGYNLFTMRQASRRSWRINQDKDIQVYFLYYKRTIQEQALSLMATKLQASMSIEGKFNEEGLAAMSNNEDILTQIANSVTEGIKNTVDIQVFQKTKVVNHKKQVETAKDVVEVKELSQVTPYDLYTPEKKVQKKSDTIILLDSLYNLV